jgi:hypothetical protein
MKQLKKFLCSLFEKPVCIDAPIMHELINGIKRKTIILALIEGKIK